MQTFLADVATQVQHAARRRDPDGPPSDSRLAEVLDTLQEDYASVSHHRRAGGANDGTEEGNPSVPSPAQPVDDGPLQQLASVFDLTTTDVALLAVAVAVDLDANLGLAFELLCDGVASGSRHVSVGVALELCQLGTADPEARQRLASTAPLRRHRLLELSGDGPWPSRFLRVPDRVVSHLIGETTPEPGVASMLVRSEVVVTKETPTVASAIDLGARLVYVRSALGSPGAAVAAGAFAQLGVRVLTIDLQRLPAGLSPSDGLALAVREAGLLRSGLVVLAADTAIVPDRTARPDHTVTTVLEHACVPVVAVGQRGWDASWTRDLPVSVDAVRLPVDTRLSVWARALDTIDVTAPPWRDVVALRLDPQEISTTARYATAIAAVRHEPLTPDAVREAARRLSAGSRTKPIGTRTAASLDDLVLPDLQHRQIEQFIGWAQHRDTVLAQGAINGPGGKGTGLSALLSGGPGTGKTLAAHVVADTLGLDLYPVDLSTIVDKYVGETEKNLERVFHEAESLNVVLFFDEADSLFGSRSQVTDSRDRYANIEVAYLLQRIEQFDGIVVLATNLQANVDAAFSRRLDFIIRFPDPDEPTRRRLWSEHLARLEALDADDPVRIEEIAATIDLAGGHVRNIVMAAAYDAATSGRPVGMALVADAVRREYSKIGRRAPAAAADWPTAG